MLIYKHEKEYWWKPLENYNIFYEKEPIKPVIIEGIEKYECVNGVWNKTIYSENRDYKNIVGYILKTMEYYIREYLGYRKIKLPEENEIFKDIQYDCFKKIKNIVLKISKMNLQEIIHIETIKFLEENKIPKMIFKKQNEKQNEFEKEEKIEIVFNQEQFDKIRERSEEIQKALIIEEDIKENDSIQEKTSKEDTVVSKKEPEKVEEQIALQENNDELIEENVFKKFVYNLTPTEKEIMNVLLEKEDIENKIMKIAQSQNEMIEVMISNINDKALETIGDTLIEFTMSSIYEDYEDEIKQVL